MTQTVTEKDIYIHNRILSAYLGTLERHQRLYYSALIRSECMITPRKFQGWIRSESRIEPLYRKKIEEVLGKEIFGDEQ